MTPEWLVTTLADVGLGDGFNFDDLFWAAAGATAVLTLITALIRPLRSSRRFFTRIGEFLEDWNGHPPDPDRGIPEVPGVMARLLKVESEVSHNHGSSLKDHIARLGQATAQMRHEIAELKRSSATATKQDEINTKLDGVTQRMDDPGDKP